MKCILRPIVIIGLYELSKYVTYEIIARVQANDDIDMTPTDYEITGGR